METTTAEKIENGLQVLDQREAGLIALADKYKDLKIAGVEDKDGYKKVREARIELKNARVAVENDAYALRENAVKFQKAVVAREKQLVLITLRTEKALQEEEDKYKKALEEIRIEEERKRQAKIQDRINALAKFNCAIDLYDASTMPDDKFNELLTQAEIDFKAEQERITAEKAEQERLRNEEAERLRAEREGLERIRQEQQARELELRRQEEELIASEKKRLDKIRLENESIAAERRKLEAEKRAHEEAIRLEQAKKEAAERARLDEQERIKREAEEKVERERLAKIEAERQEALKPDKEKLYQYAKALMAIPLPTLSHEDAIAIERDISERVVQTSEFIHDKAKEL
jgi:hypothetical protein